MKNLGMFSFLLVLSPFILSFSFGLDIYIPVVPQMVSVFNTSAQKVQLTLSLFLVCAGLGQLIVGPLCDRFGRKPTYYASSCAFAVGSLICAFSPRIEILIGGRLLSAMGACGMLVAAFATVRDLFSGIKSAKMFSFVNATVGISPTFAPIVGGYLALYFGWKSNFIFLFFIGLCALLFAYFFIEETHNKNNIIKLDKSIISQYLKIFLNPEFLIFATLAGLAEGVFFGFFSLSPFIIIQQLGIAPENFGYFFAVFGSMIGLGGMFSGHIITPGRQNLILKSGIALMFVGGASMLIWYNLFSLSLAGFLLPMALSCFGAIIILGSSAAAALEPFSHIAATASAMLGALQFGLSSLIGSIVVFFPTTSTLPYGITILVVAILSALLMLLHNFRRLATVNQ
jgi:DHA1 family bicyclomycin/chloramphenicol resistance-like MFS transporter